MNHILRNGIRFSILTAALFGAICCPGQTSQDGAGPANPVPNQAARGRMGRPNQDRQLLRSSGIINAHFHAEVCEVQAAADRLETLDGKALDGSTATDETFFKALQEVGKVRVLYHLDQILNVYSGSILFGASEPVPLAGPRANSIMYVTMGAVLRLSAQMPTNGVKRDVPDVAFNLRLSGFAPRDAGNGTNKAPAATRADLRGVSLERTGPLEFGRPMAATAQSAQSADGKPATPVAYVVRYIFDKPGPPDNPAAGASLEKDQPPQPDTANGLAAGFSVTNVPARFQATIYQLDATPGRVDALDATALAAHAATAETLLKSLSDYGKARILHRIDKLVNACSNQTQLITYEAMLSDAHPGLDGNFLPTYTQTRTGATVELSSQMIPKGMPGEGPAVTTAVRLSCLIPSELDLAPGMPASSVPTLATENTEPLRFNQPRVFVAARSIYSREQAAPVVYIIRYLLSPPAGP